VEAKEEVDGVLGALGEAQDPRTFCVHAKPLVRGRQWGHDANAPMDPGPRHQSKKEDPETPKEMM
jgi:hypothetical protein